MPSSPDLPTAAPAARPKKRNVDWGIGICVVLAVIGVALIPGFYVEERIRGKMEWRNYQEEAKARGVKLDFAAFIPPKIPDGENFASIPLFEAAFRASDSGQEIPDPFKLPKSSKGQIPLVNDPVKQTTIDLAAWQKYFLETKLLSTASDNAAADVLKALDGYSSFLAEIHEAAKRPHCRFPVHWEQGWQAQYPYLQLIQDAARLDALRLASHLALGDSVAAYQDFRDGLNLSIAIRGEPTLIPGLVRISITTIIESPVWGGLARRQWTEPELRKMEADLAALDWLADCRFAFESERAASNTNIETFLKNPRLFSGLVRQEEGENARFGGIVGDLLYPTGWHYQSLARMNRYFDEVLAQTDPTLRRWLGERPVPSSPNHGEDMPTKIHYALFMIITPVLEGIQKKYLQFASITDQACIACALERFRLAHGQFPETLSELTPESLAQVPSEVVNGEPYRYRRTEDGAFVLYSVGMDLRDDGGVIDPKLSASKQLDWVWRYPEK